MCTQQDSLKHIPCEHLPLWLHFHWLLIHWLMLMFDKLYCRQIFSVLPAHCWPCGKCLGSWASLCQTMLYHLLVIFVVYLIVFSNTDQIQIHALLWFSIKIQIHKISVYIKTQIRIWTQPWYWMNWEHLLTYIFNELLVSKHCFNNDRFEINICNIGFCDRASWRPCRLSNKSWLMATCRSLYDVVDPTTRRDCESCENSVRRWWYNMIYYIHIYISINIYNIHKYKYTLHSNFQHVRMFLEKLIVCHNIHICHAMKCKSTQISNHCPLPRTDYAICDIYIYTYCIWTCIFTFFVKIPRVIMYLLYVYINEKICLLGQTLGVPIHVFGPETHMTAIVGMALGKKTIPAPAKRQATTANFLLPGGQVRVL